MCASTHRSGRSDDATLLTPDQHQKGNDLECETHARAESNGRTKGRRSSSPQVHERQALARMRSELASTKGPDIDDALRLIDALLKHGVKIEQERY